jgi:hypothetical protein
MVQLPRRFILSEKYAQVIANIQNTEIRLELGVTIERYTGTSKKLSIHSNESRVIQDRGLLLGISYET